MATIKQLNFAGGELAPALHYHNDLAKYQAGLATCRNLFVKKDGGIQNRQGGKFTSETYRNNKSRVIEFSVGASFSLGVEFTDQKIRILSGGVPVLTTATPLEITAVTQGANTIITYNGTDPVDGTEIILYHAPGFSKLGELAGHVYRIDSVDTAANTFSLRDVDNNAINSINMQIGSGGIMGFAGFTLIIPVPYYEADIPFIDYAQSVDVITLVHPSYPVAELKMTGFPNLWSYNVVNFTPTVAGNFNTLSAAQQGTVGSTVWNYGVTSIDLVTGLESDPQYASISNGNANIDVTNNVLVSWNALTVGQTFYVYRQVNGVYGFIGASKSTTTGTSARFKDVGVVPDISEAIEPRYNPFDAGGKYPSCVTYYQQRTWYANTIQQPETVFASKTGRYNVFTKRTPGTAISDDGAIEFNLSGRTRNPVSFLLDLAGLVMFTEQSEWSLGRSNDAVTPTSVNPTQQSYNGTKRGLRPLVINDTALYVQSRGSIVREFGYQYEVDGYRGDDMTVFASHLFEGKQLVDWCYQQTPNSIIWAVRSDGVLLGLTHIKEQQILAWHRHDFEGGFVEGIFNLREDTKDVVYAIVRRTIGEVTKRYYERLESRSIISLDDCKFLDSHYSYDGQHYGTEEVTITDPTNAWTYNVEMAIDNPDYNFSSRDIGNEIHVTGSDGEMIRFRILRIQVVGGIPVAYGKPNRTLPASLRGIGTTKWAYALAVVRGLNHLVGQKVSIFADGNVVGSVHNSSYVNYTVTATPTDGLPVGSVRLDKPYVKITVGLPITADVETLNIDSTNGETLMNRYKQIGQVTLAVEKSRGIFIGGRKPKGDDYLEGMTEAKTRNLEDYDEPTKLVTGIVPVVIESHWNSNGRVFIRQVDPLPLSVLAIAPEGLIPFKG